MKIKQINLLLYFCIGFAALINLVSTNTLATKGIEINGFYQEAESLKKVNQQLEAEINKYNNLSYIQQLGESKGFKRIDKISLVFVSSLVASKPDTIYP